MTVAALAARSHKLGARQGKESGSAAAAPPAAGRDSEGSRLRVAVVTETYPPEVNGVALTLAQVVRGLHARGHEVALVRPRQPADRDGARATLAGSPPPRSGDAGPAPIAEHLVAGMPIPFYANLRMGLPARRQLLRTWGRDRPDVVHVATEGPLGRSAVHAARQLGIALTSDFRTNFHAYTQHYGLSWLRQPILGYLRQLHNLTSATMVPTQALRMELEALGFANLEVVSRGVDVGRFDPALRSAALRQTWGAGDDAPVVLYVGRLAAEKNLGLLVRSFRAIAQQQPTARLVLVGDGPQRESLRAALPRAHFAGQRQGVDLATHYASADLFLFPSLTETFGNVTAEAMASGLAVVAFDYAAAAQLIQPGSSGTLIARGNEAQFERAGVALAGSHATRRALGMRARAQACEHDWGTVLSRFERVLWSAVRRQRPVSLEVVREPPSGTARELPRRAAQRVPQELPQPQTMSGDKAA